jgi:hypothetical protein
MRAGDEPLFASPLIALLLGEARRYPYSWDLVSSLAMRLARRLIVYALRSALVILRRPNAPVRPLAVIQWRDEDDRLARRSGSRNCRQADSS